MTSNMFFRSRLGAPGDSCQSDEHLETDDNGEARCVPDPHVPFVNGDCPSGYHPGPLYGPNGAQTVCYKDIPTQGGGSGPEGSEVVCVQTEDGGVSCGPAIASPNHCGKGRVPGPRGCMPDTPCPAGQSLFDYGPEGWFCGEEGPETPIFPGYHPYVKASPEGVGGGQKPDEESSSIPTIATAIAGAALGALAGRALGKGSPSISVAGGAIGGLVGAMAGAWLKP